MRCSVCVAFSLFIALLAGLPTSTYGQEADPKPEAKPSQQELETALAERLTGATLNGFFTITGRNDEQKPTLRGERYDLIEVRHLEGNKWLFTSRIRYGEHDVTLPMTLPVEWAGDTPVVVVDNIGFPGLGTYSARVLFHKSHYAGHWQGGDHGGHLFGTIERMEADESAAE